MEPEFSAGDTVVNSTFCAEHHSGELDVLEVFPSHQVLKYAVCDNTFLCRTPMKNAIVAAVSNTMFYKNTLPCL